MIVIATVLLLLLLLLLLGPCAHALYAALSLLLLYVDSLVNSARIALFTSALHTRKRTRKTLKLVINLTNCLSNSFFFFFLFRLSTPANQRAIKKTDVKFRLRRTRERKSHRTHTRMRARYFCISVISLIPGAKLRSARERE